MKELKSIKKYRTLQVITIALGRASPALATCAAITTFYFVEGQLDPGNIFAAFSVFQALRLVLIVLPHSLTSWANLRVSLSRMDDFLQLPDKTPRKTVSSGSRVLTIENVDVGTTTTPGAMVSIDSAIELLRGFGILLSEEADKISQRTQCNSIENIIVKGVSFTINRGEITAIVGPVGSGKSALVSTIIGDLKPLRGDTQCHESVGYVPQQAVVISGTILDNILFGRPYNSEQMDSVLASADFGADVRSFPKGLMVRDA